MAGGASGGGGARRPRTPASDSSDNQLSFHVHSLLLFRLLLRIEFLYDRALAIAIRFALEPVVDGGQGDVRFGELRRLFDDGFQIAARGVELAFVKRDGRELVARAEIVGANLQGAAQAGDGFGELLVLFQQDGELQVGGEVVRIGVERFAKGCGGAGGIAGAQQRLAVVGVGVGQIRIQLDGFREVGERGGVVAGVEFGGAEEEPGFGGVAVAQDAVDEELSARSAGRRGSGRVPSR